ncbi:FMN reductase [Corynebacterium epidermidicanis]|uniref:LLM-partnered FMN reductase, CE1759 family n=1 Tax=Corynebacterium epidermidicanis TaxID=1050174 RepID=A0A0G3GUR5_9CORY|nr:FMN reductase [Corynebacterium epidermidicanis]AKK03263.1 LLM-partnered FMN reductase, CE1759 family [Corynebacterium epidermidicanis]
MRQVVIVSAGLSNPSTTKSLADQLGNTIRAAVSARGEAVEITHVELRLLATDLATALVTGGTLSPNLSAALDAVVEADGLVAVTPVFSASYSGLFKMFFDVLDREALVGKPTLLAATAGTARHSLVLDFAMRPLFSYLKANVMPTAVFAATEDFGGEHSRELQGRIQRAAAEFAPAVLAERTSVGGLGGVLADRKATASSGGFEALLSQHMG